MPLSDDDTDALDAAIEAINDPERLKRAQEIVAHAAPALQGVLAKALAEGGWFDSAHAAAVRDAVVAEADPTSGSRAVNTLLAEETRLGMLVGVAVGFELGRELEFHIETQRGGLTRDGRPLSRPCLLLALRRRHHGADRPVPDG